MRSVLYALSGNHTPSAGQSSHGTSNAYYHLSSHRPCTDGNGAPAYCGCTRDTRLGDPSTYGDGTARPRRLSSTGAVGAHGHAVSPAHLYRHRPAASGRRDRGADEQESEGGEGNHIKII